MLMVKTVIPPTKLGGKIPTHTEVQSESNQNGISPSLSSYTVSWQNTLNQAFSELMTSWVKISYIHFRLSAPASHLSAQNILSIGHRLS